MAKLVYKLKVEANGGRLSQAARLWENGSADISEAVYEAAMIAESRMGTLGATEEEISRAWESLQECMVAEWHKGKKSVVASVWAEEA